MNTKMKLGLGIGAIATAITGVVASKIITSKSKKKIEEGEFDENQEKKFKIKSRIFEGIGVAGVIAGVATLGTILINNDNEENEMEEIENNENVEEIEYNNDGNVRKYSEDEKEELEELEKLDNKIKENE